MWTKDWDIELASRTRREFEAEQKRKHEEKLAKNKADREAKRRASKNMPPEEYPWMKNKQKD